MASDVEICNRALQKLGAKRITSLSQDSVNARACNFAYEPVKLALLRAYEWSFSIARAQLAADSEEPSWGKANAFQLPSDYVQLASDYPEDNSNTKDWQIEGRKIFTDDAAPLYVRYIYNVTDPNEMDSLFREALSTKLALELCEEITQSNTKKDVLKDDFRLAIADAKKSGAIAKIPVQPPEDPWLTCRN